MFKPRMCSACCRACVSFFVGQVCPTYVFVLLKVGNCHSEDEVRRISISWTTNANPCDSSLRSERHVLCHCEPRSGVAIQYLFQPNKILKQVQDDAIRNFRNELFNLSTIQLKNLDCFVVLRTPRNDRKSF